MKRRVVITGMGALSPIGNDVKSMWENGKKGTLGIDYIKQFDTTDFETKIAGEVKNLEFTDYIDKKDLKKYDIFTRFALIAAKEAYEDSDLDKYDFDRERAGVMIATGVGGLRVIEQEKVRGIDRGYERVSPYFIPMAIVNMAAGAVSIQHDLHGMSTCPVTACASSTNSIGDAFRAIRDGYQEIILAGGTEASITELGVGGFKSMRALSESNDPKRASIPFDKERSGFVMGEGAGVLVLEELEHALKRGAKIYGEVVGYGATCDAHHITAPNPEGVWAARCMELAMEDGGIGIDDVQYINAHGTSTPLNDKGETLAIKKVFGDKSKNLLVSSTKSMTGHLLGATGAIEAILTTLMLKEGYVLPTINYEVPDADCDLDIVPNEGREANISCALSNSFGFGGHNATIALKKYE